MRSAVIGGAAALVLALTGVGASGAAAVPVPTPASAVAAVPTTISASVGVSPVKVGQQSVLSGTVRSTAGTRIPGATVELWSRPVGSTAWAKVATGRGNAAGEYAFSQRIVVATVSQVRAPVWRLQSAPVVIGAIGYFQAVAFWGCDDGPIENQWMEYAGRTTPLAAGSTAVALYRPAGDGPWVESGRTTVRSDGSFSWTGQPYERGAYDAQWVIAKKGVTAKASPLYSGFVSFGDFNTPLECFQFEPKK